jgi:hypothetical protein
MHDLREIIRSHMWTHNSTARDGQGRLYGWSDDELDAMIMDVIQHVIIDVAVAVHNNHMIAKNGGQGIPPERRAEWIMGYVTEDLAKIFDMSAEDFRTVAGG